MKRLLKIEIDPMGKPRLLRGQQTRTADRWRAWKTAIRIMARGKELPLSKMHLIFCIPMPKSWSKKKRAEHLGKPHLSKPDLDNCIKALLDALYPKNDSQFWDFRATKLWSSSGRIEIYTEDQG